MSSRTSRTSSTSDRPRRPDGFGAGWPERVQPGFVGRAGGILRLAHPFPSTLDAVVTGVLAWVAGGSVGVAVRLAIAMLAIQAAIGAANDVMDAALDAEAKPAKPIHAGIVSRRDAIALTCAGFGVGLGLAGTVSVAALALGSAGASVGLAYDLRLKGTAWSWLPFAVGIPILPLFAWVGAAGGAPDPVLVLAAIAVPAGAAIAIANALPDLERDETVGIRSVATMLGRRRAARVVAVLQGIVAVVAVVSFRALDDPRAIGLGYLGLGLACTLLLAGVALSARPDVRSRQRGWEVQAIAIGALAATWVGGLAAAGRV